MPENSRDKGLLNWLFHHNKQQTPEPPPAPPAEVAAEIETPVDPKTEQEAKKLLAELASKQGKKFLHLIIDDSPNKINEAYQRIEEAENPDNLQWAIAAKYTGQDGIELYRQFRKAENPLQPNQVVILMDGNLDSKYGQAPYKKGIDVVDKIVEISKQNNWQLPFFVGGSSDQEENEKIQAAFPDLYLPTKRYLYYSEILSIIDTRVFNS
jgi:hypothetical protein